MALRIFHAVPAFRMGGSNRIRASGDCNRISLRHGFRSSQSMDGCGRSVAGSRAFVIHQLRLCHLLDGAVGLRTNLAVGRAYGPSAMHCLAENRLHRPNNMGSGNGWLGLSPIWLLRSACKCVDSYLRLDCQKRAAGEADNSCCSRRNSHLAFPTGMVCHSGH